MIRRSLFCMFAIMLVCQHAHSQKLARGNVADYLTGTAVPDSALTVDVLRADSTRLDTIIVESYGSGRSRETKFLVRMDVEGDYTVCISHPDYEPVRQTVHVKFYRRELNPELGTFRMRRIMKRDLGELEVKASKIKFYFKNDTLVYNADAFITQDGFMLEDILKKMPGLEFKDGKIYSNGRLVESLLLNGKDFFNNDRETLLANLPAYMVKNVKVYEKTKDSLSLYERERNFEGLVMDVRLKREYSQSAMGNAEVGGGTDDRYMLRLFGMKIHDLYRFSAYAGSNNVNSDDQVMGGYYTNMDNGFGEKKYHYGGLNYNVDEKDGKYSISGSARVNRSTNSDETFETNERYYLGGNVYSYSGSSSRTRNLSVQTGHSLTLFQNTPWSLTLRPQLSYNRSTSRSENHSLLSDTSLDGLCPQGMAGNIFSSALADTLSRLATNRRDGMSKRPTHSSMQSLAVDKQISFKHCVDYLYLTSYVMHSHTVAEGFDTYRVDYFKDTSLPSDFRRQFQDMYTDDWFCNSRLTYRPYFGIRHMQDLAFHLKHNFIRIDTNDDLYNLDRLDGWGADSGYPLGTLPYEEQLASVMDFRNSKRHIRTQNNYSAEVNHEYRFRQYGIKTEAALHVDDSRLTFLQKDNDAHPSRVMVWPGLYLQHDRRIEGQAGWGYNLNYRLESTMAPLIQMVDQVSDANTLSVYRGNPGLKNSTKNQLNATFSWKPRNMGEQRVGLSYYAVKDPLSSGYFYDKESGKTVWMPMNASRYQSVNTSLNNEILRGKASSHRITNRIDFSRTFSNSFSGTTMEEYQREYMVHNTQVTERLTYTFRSSNTRYMGTLSPYMKWMDSRSEKQGVSAIQAWHFGVQLSGQVELPWSVRLQTDVVTTSRRGYEDHSMNDNEVLWNLNLNKAFGENYSLKLEGFDILNQRKSIEREMNANGRIESIRNILRRYVMLHFVWKISSKPRKA